MRASTPSPARFAWRLMRREQAAYARTALGWILWHSWQLLPGLLAKWFFDALTGHSVMGVGPYGIAALLAASGVGRALVMYGGTRAGVPMRFRMRSLLQVRMLASLLGRPPAGSDAAAGEAVSTLRDDAEQGALATDWPYDVLAGGVFAVVGVTILFGVDARLTLLVFVPITLVLIGANALRSRLIRLRERSRQATADVTSGLLEVFRAVQSVQAAGAEERVLRHLGRLGDARRHAAVADTVQDAAFDAGFNYTMQAGAGIVLLLAAAELRGGSFSVGDFALFATYLMQVAQFMGFVGYLIGSYQESSVSFARMVRLLRGAPPMTLVASAEVAPKPPLPLPPLEVLRVQGLSMQPHGRLAVRDVSMTVHRGRLTALTGGVGSGKTTVLRALLGELPATGDILWNGALLQDPGSALRPPRAAYVPQTPRLLSATLAENVLLGLPRDEEALRRAARIAALDRDLDEMSQGWDTEIGPGGVRLSGGQAQRLAIARALVRHPEFLLLDDVSSALDPETEERLWEELLSLGAGCLAVSSSAALLRRAEEIVWLEGGKVRAVGTLQELAQQGLGTR